MCRHKTFVQLSEKRVKCLTCGELGTLHVIETDDEEFPIEIEIEWDNDIYKRELTELLFDF